MVALTWDQEPLAEAMAIQHRHGDRAALWIAERVGVLLLIGDNDGVERFTRIAIELEKLLGATLH